MSYKELVNALKKKGEIILSSAKVIDYFIETPQNHFSIPVKVKKLQARFQSVFVETEDNKTLELEMSSFVKGDYFEEKYPDLNALSEIIL